MDWAVIGMIVAGLFLLVTGGELLVRGASRLALAAGMTPLVIGLTVVAFGTSAPEMATSVGAGLQGQGDIALGNVVGSNTFNVLFILGASALIAPLVVAQKLVRIDVPLMIGASVLVAITGWDGNVSPLEGLFLLAGLGGYVYLCLRTSGAETTEVQAEYTHAAERDTFRGRMTWSVVSIVAGLALLVLGSQWLVGGAVEVARTLGLSELIIGLTIVAAGTSLPEVATSLLAAYRGERDIAVGNVIGSNIFNIFGVLGTSALVSPGGLAVSESAMRVDIPVMIATAVACLPVFFKDFRVARWEGAVMMGYYAAYVAFLIFDATDHEATNAFRWTMLGFVLPLTALTFTVVAVRNRNLRNRMARA